MQQTVNMLFKYSNMHIFKGSQRDVLTQFRVNEGHVTSVPRKLCSTSVGRSRQSESLVAISI